MGARGSSGGGAEVLHCCWVEECRWGGGDGAGAGLAPAAPPLCIKCHARVPPQLQFQPPTTVNTTSLPTQFLPPDFKNVSIVGHYIKERTKNAQFVIISLRNNMFELADRLVGIYKVRELALDA